MKRNRAAPSGAAAVFGGRRSAVAGCALALALMALTDPAAAQTGGTAGLQVIDNVAKAVADFLTGTFAKTVSTIAVAALGYGALRGHIRLGWALSIIGGIALIFGAAQIVGWLSQASGSGG